MVAGARVAAAAVAAAAAAATTDGDGDSGGEGGGAAGGESKSGGVIEAAIGEGLATTQEEFAKQASTLRPPADTGTSLCPPPRCACLTAGDAAQR